MAASGGAMRFCCGISLALLFFVLLHCQFICSSNSTIAIKQSMPLTSGKCRSESSLVIRSFVSTYYYLIINIILSYSCLPKYLNIVNEFNLGDKYDREKVCNNYIMCVQIQFRVTLIALDDLGCYCLYITYHRRP